MLNELDSSKSVGCLPNALFVFVAKIPLSLCEGGTRNYLTHLVEQGSKVSQALYCATTQQSIKYRPLEGCLYQQRLRYLEVEIGGIDRISFITY